MTSGSTFSSRTTARRSLAGLVSAIALIVAFATMGAIGPGVAEAAPARPWPAPTGHLNDFAHIVDPVHADSIEQLAVELKQKTGAELSVVTTSDLGGEEIDAAATQLVTEWGIGRKGENDGVLILLALAERRVRIEPGYGLEGVLPDGRCGYIIRRVMGPDLSADRFGIGLHRGAQAVAAAVAKEKGVVLTGAAGMDPPSPDGGQGLTASGLFLLLFLLMIFVLMGSAFNRRTRGRRGWSDWSGRGGGWYGPWGGGGFGGGFGGLGGLGGGGSRGGFGGFGGGMSGGGGASGRF